MATERTFDCPVCGTKVVTKDARKMYCTKRCADRSRNQVISPIVAQPEGRVYRAKQPTKAGQFDSTPELRFFSYLTDAGKEKVLLGQGGFSVVMYDIEATHLKPNVGRILCTSFKPVGEDVYTFSALDRRFRERDTYDDGKLAIAVNEELEKYDIIVGWNSKNFDYKFVNARAVRKGGRVKAPQYHVDGMWSWRSKVSAWSGLNNVQRFALPDNEASKTSIEWDKWMQALGWDKGLREAAMAEIIEHCELDVQVLEDVYRMQIEAGMMRSIRKDGGVL